MARRVTSADSDEECEKGCDEKEEDSTEEGREEGMVDTLTGMDKEEWKRWMETLDEKQKLFQAPYSEKKKTQQQKKDSKEEVSPLRRQRLEELENLMGSDGFDIQQIVQNSPSEEIFAWFKTSSRKPFSMGNHCPTPVQTAQSTKMNAEDAYNAFSKVSACRALYFRASAELEDRSLNRFARALGMDFAGYNRGISLQVFWIMFHLKSEYYGSKIPD